MADYRDPTISEESVNAAADAVVALADSGKLRYYSGAIPASISDPIGAAVQLCELTFGADAFGAAGAGALDPGVAAANAITGDDDADATGLASFFRVYKSNGTSPLWQGTIGQAADPQTDTYDMYMNNPSIQQHAAVTCSEFYYTARGWEAAV